MRPSGKVQSPPCAMQPSQARICCQEFWKRLKLTPRWSKFLTPCAPFLASTTRLWSFKPRSDNRTPRGKADNSTAHPGKDGCQSDSGKDSKTSRRSTSPHSFHTAYRHISCRFQRWSSYENFILSQSS